MREVGVHYEHEVAGRVLESVQVGRAQAQLPRPRPQLLPRYRKDS